MTPNSWVKFERELLPLVRDARSVSHRKPGTRAERSTTRSHFGGAPYLDSPELWPQCSCCSLPLSFVCQLNLEDAALESVTQTGILSFFYCWNCRKWEGDDPGQGYAVLFSADPKRSVDPSPPPGNSVTVLPHRVMRFSKVRSLPDWEGVDDFLPGFCARFSKVASDDPWEDYEALLVRLGVRSTLSTQLGGYPRWLQSADPPANFIDGQALAVPLLQFDSDDKAGLDWRDGGLLYLFADPDAPAFRLQCT